MKPLRWIIAAVLLLGRLMAATSIPIQVDSTTRVLVSPTNAWTANKAGISNALTLGSLSQQNANAVAITGGSISGISALPIASGGTGATNAGGALANLGAGTVTSFSVTSANGISGTVANASTTPNLTLNLGAVTPTSVAVGGTGGAGFVSYPSQSAPPAAPANGFVKYADSLGRMAWRRASDGFVRTVNSTLTADRVYTWPDASTVMPIIGQQLTIAGPTAARTVTFPDASFSAARSDASQTFSGLQTFGGSLEAQNGASGTWIDIFKTSSGGGANFEKIRIDGGVTVGSEFSIKTLFGGTGTAARPLSIYGGAGLWLQSDAGNVTLNASGACVFRAGGANRANVTTTAFAPQSPNALDLGSVGLEWKNLNTYSATIIAPGAASTPAESITGTWFSGGTSTTTKPQLLIEPTGTTSTAWSPLGTGFGINAASGSSANLIDAQVAGVSRFRVASTGDVTAGKINNVTVTAGTGSPALTVNGSATVSGVNTGDQQVGGATGWRFYEEFNWNASNVGGNGWLITSSGGAIQMVASPAANRPGLIQLSTAASTTGNPNIMDNASALFLGGGPLTMEWSSRITTGLPSTADDYDVWAGLGDTQTTSSQTDGVYFLLDRGLSASNWQFVTAKAGTRQTTDTGIAANGSSVFQKFRFEVNAAATAVIAYIDGVACATNTSFLPDTSANLCGKMFGVLKQGGTTGTTPEILQIDYVFVSQDFTSSR